MKDFELMLCSQITYFSTRMCISITIVFYNGVWDVVNNTTYYKVHAPGKH